MASRIEQIDLAWFLTMQKIGQELRDCYQESELPDEMRVLLSQIDDDLEVSADRDSVPRVKPRPPIHS